MEASRARLIDRSVSEIKRKYITSQDDDFRDGEIVIGLVGAVGTDLEKVSELISDRLKHYRYNSICIKVSKDIIKPLLKIDDSSFLANEAERITEYMNAGDKLRQKQPDIISVAIAAHILHCKAHDGNSFIPNKRYAYIIKSLKHPAEIQKLREIYKNGFYLFGVFTEESEKLKYLKRKGIKDTEIAYDLIRRDEHFRDYGQQTRESFQMSDFFVNYSSDNQNIIERSIERILDLIFGHPFYTPTFDEYAMYMAYVNSLRSADLSRQIGAVVAKDNEIISTGTNDCPKALGGLYWPIVNIDGRVYDHPQGRDYLRKCDSNKKQLLAIIDNVLVLLGNKPEDPNYKELVELLYSKSLLGDLTEYGRIVHAEMEAILMCARNTISTRNAHLYCTTFPCHNCAKHIVAAGITRVVFIEPYPKSKSADFYSDSIYLSQTHNPDDERVQFSHFIGVGPRRFNDLFSMKPPDGNVIIRKDNWGNAVDWDTSTANLRQQMFPYSYLDRETDAFTLLGRLDINKEENQGGNDGSRKCSS